LIVFGFLRTDRGFRHAPCYLDKATSTQIKNKEGHMNAKVETVDRDEAQKAQILLMEDEAVVAEGLQMILSEDGYGVEIAGTGNGALERLHSKQYDLLVADLCLPDINGMEVIKKLKATRPETFVIVITGYSTVDTAVEAMRVGASDYLAKPFTDEQIRTAVVKTLQGRKTRTAPATTGAPDQQSRALIEKREVMRVLNRTSEDDRFWNALIQDGTEALADYELSDEAKAAIVSGDLGWINAHIGELTQKQLMFIYKRLEREAW
jgi:DNA-binding response OmpR family regulator